MKCQYISNEMQIHIVLEIAAEMAEYPGNTNLKGETEVGEDLTKVCAMYSEHFAVGNFQTKLSGLYLKQNQLPIGNRQTARSK